MEELAGRTLGDFVVRHRVGEGGFGAVYRAEQAALGRDAIIKVLHARLRHSKTVIQRFLREARLASKLDHPYAAHIYAFGVESDGLMWIAMEYVKGQTLHDVLRRGPMTLDDFIPLLDRICEVLQAAHDLGIVHRDIKPPNVMVVQRSGRAFPKLLDFGIAKLAGDEITSHPPPDIAPDASSLTRAESRTPPRVVEPAPPLAGDNTVPFVGQPGGAIAAALAVRHNEDARGFVRTVEAPARLEEVLTEAGAAVGSPPYMAPEQWFDSAATTARTDLYALAVLTYEALTGRRPFTAATVTGYALAHSEAPVPPLGGTLPVALDEVMRKALAKDPADRYASVLDFAQAFRAAAGFGEQPLPTLDEELRVSVEASFPQPVAEAIASFHASRNAHQARDALRDVASTAIRYLAMIALAAHGQVRVEDGGTVVAESLRTLRRRALTDEEWLQLSRALVAPFRTRREAHPLPQLVTLLLDDDEMGPLALLTRPRSQEPDPLPLIRELLPEITRLLRSLTFLADYTLVVADQQRAESWMGVRRPRRVALEVRGRAIEPGHPVLLDAASRPIVVLWPIVQTSSPMPGTPAELFMLDGSGRRGARMVAMPNTLERQDETVWQWLAETFAQHDRDTPVSGDSSDARPYRGLAAFSTQDADAFVGREREVDAAINRLATSAFIAVVGPSGAGKSSFVHAGILSSLPSTWTAISVRPSGSPIATLEQRLRRAGIAIPDLRAALEANPNALAEAFEARDATTVLVVDQFEELFTLGAPVAEARLYVRGLLAAAQAPDDKLRLVLTLRDDFLGRAAQLPELRDRLSSSLFLLGTPARSDLVRILTEPLAKLGFDFDDPKLPARMVDDVVDTPGALALLSFTAAKLWELRDRHFRQLTRSAYDALGGVAGALAQHAEATLANLSPHEQRLARGALAHLVTADGTRATLTRGELDQLLRDPASATVLEKLVTARLLVTTESEGGDERLEIIHEALLVAWPRLARWRREDQEGARLRDQVRAAARQWVERERPRGLLWRDEALAELQLWRTRHEQPLTEAEHAFVTASLAEATRGRRLRRGVIGVVIASMALAVAVLVWARGSAQATAARDRDRVRRELVERGRQNVLAGNSAAARETFAEARRLGAADTPALRFLEILAARPIRGRTATLRGHTAFVRSAEFSRDGTRVLTESADNTVRVWDASTARQLLELRDCRGTLLMARFDPDSRWIAAACDDGVVRIYDATGARAHELVLAGQHAQGQRYAFLAFSADGKYLTIAYAGIVELWDVVSGRRTWASEAGNPQSRVAITPDGTVAALGLGAPTATIWNVDGTVRHVLKLNAAESWEPQVVQTTAITFDRTGAHLFTVARMTEVAQIWDAASGELLGQLEARSGPITRLRVTADGRRVVIASKHAVQIWSVASKKVEQTLGIDAKDVFDVAFSPDDKLLGATQYDGSLGIWDVASGTQVAVLQGHKGASWTLGFDPQSARVVTAGTDSTAILWSLREAAMARVIASDSGINGFEIRGDRLLVTSNFATVYATADGRILAQREIGPSGDAHFVDDHSIAIVDQHGKLWLWDLSNDSARELAQHAQPGDWLVTDGRGTIASWAGPEVIIADARTGKAVHWKASARVTAIVFRASRGIAVGDSAGTIHLLAPDGTVEGSWRAQGAISRLRMLADGRLASASPHAVQVWPSEGAPEPITFEHEAGEIRELASDHAARLFATSAVDGTVHVWDLSTRRRRVELRHTSSVSLVFSADDQLLFTIDDEGIVRAWSVATGDLLAELPVLGGRGLIGMTSRLVVAVGEGSVVLLPI